MRGVAVALGNFDGVHLGHQAVIGRAVEEGKGEGVVAATFSPHPREVLSPGNGPELLTPSGLREELLLRYGARRVHLIKFDEELSRRSPREFVEEVLVGEIGASVVVVGENFRFGHRAAGDFSELRKVMREFGGEAHAVAVKSVGGRIVSSTAIRRLIQDGRLEEAAALIGRPYIMRGEVVKGESRGKGLGFPTANIDFDPRAVVPRRGIYAGFAKVRGERHLACTNVGISPTFEGSIERVEAYILDFEEDIYGETIDIEFNSRLRAEERYDSVEALKEQISRDVEHTRRLLGGRV